MDTSRYLHFISDFPHPVKYTCNFITAAGLQTPGGRVSSEYVNAAWKCDRLSIVPPKAMPHVTKAVFQPHGFEKMRVNPVFILFSDEVLTGLYVYNYKVETCYGPGSSGTTSLFVSRLKNVIASMILRHSQTALRPGTEQLRHIVEFQVFINIWEATIGK